MSKVLTHPDKDEIIKKLLDGESVKSVANWISSKYPKKQRLHISYMTLQKFRKDHLNIHGEILEDIKAAREEAVQDLTVKEANFAETKMLVANTSAYQKKISEIVEGEFDVSKKLKEMDAIVSSRLEFYFNNMDSQNFELKNIAYDKIFIEYLNAYKSILQDWKKYIDGVADKTIEHNININVVNEQVNIIKSVVFEVLQELDPTLIPSFITKLNTRMIDLQYNSEDYRKLGVIDVSKGKY